MRIDGFDELFEELEKDLAGLDRFTVRGPGTATLSEVSAFDERTVLNATIEDLDLDLALSILREYCEKPKRAPGHARYAFLL